MRRMAYVASVIDGTPALRVGNMSTRWIARYDTLLYATALRLDTRMGVRHVRGDILRRGMEELMIILAGMVVMFFVMVAGCLIADIIDSFKDEDSF